MGSPLGPTLANIIMTALEDEIVKDLLDSNIIKSYITYVDDKLVLAKPSDITLILHKLNSYHPQIQFTNEEFVDNNDVHFLDIKITFNGTTIFRKNTHTGQYIHLTGFTLWTHKIAWIRSLVNRAFKICSCKSLLSDEINNILKFMSWNGFSKNLSAKLWKKLIPNSDTSNHVNSNQSDTNTDRTNQLPKSLGKATIDRQTLNQLNSEF